MKASSIATKIRRAWAQLKSKLYFQDTHAVRTLLIGAALSWGSWLLSPGSSIDKVPALDFFRRLTSDDWLIALIPITIALFQIVASVERFEKARPLADSMALSWWLALVIVYFISNPFAPSIGIFIVLAISACWVVWRDVKPKPAPMEDSDPLGTHPSQDDDNIPELATAGSAATALTAAASAAGSAVEAKESAIDSAGSASASAAALQAAASAAEAAASAAAAVSAAKSIEESK